MTTFVGSNVETSTRASSSKGPLACAWMSLFLEEQLANFNCIVLKLYCEPYFLNPFNDVAFIKSTTRLVEELRKDPWTDIKSIFPRVADKERILCEATPLHWAVLMDDRTMVRYILTS